MRGTVKQLNDNLKLDTTADVSEDLTVDMVASDRETNKAEATNVQIVLNGLDET
ncbi:hypothetical protein [Veronia nyctiphanis]|uniref:hypothetical protein n=1 Tax=Veronia nyctiphanis TaxID=1278244 RepID=UPI001375663A|nr:hypothetical protein [Veronia nyctiphanis]